jgi:tetratricopeptide (TPR) repeat protein
MQSLALPTKLQNLLCRNALEPLVIEEAYHQICNQDPTQVQDPDQEVLSQVIAYALNRLPALYATSQVGWEMQQQLARETLQDQIRATVRTGIMAVCSNPLRSSWLSEARELRHDHIRQRQRQSAISTDAFIRLSESELANVSLLELDALLQRQPDHAEAWMQRGWRRMQAKEYDAALENFDVAAEINPQNIDIWLVRSLILHELGRHEQAIASYQQANSVSVAKTKMTPVSAQA